ncbi:Response regulator receiver domain-containing protein [Malonomonas rubra DSM 5091]|uniref:Response regulator receiver domain-containing protein n=1 Tax=Malonomonas rubra DSM 5091 TaxID=1122189 RepID=A0A1M6J8S4_MALRU|nr:response regulator [Malonomonas rubra]SHJ43067.1 Response regulator receiver domain-containing protein [Malonomonas rubra DSM 5091]
MAEDGKKILYVDDEQGLALLGEEFLGDLGYQVTAAFGGEEAFAAFGQADPPFDLIVTDESMPGISGIELAQKIYEVAPQVPVFICSGHLLSNEEEGMDKTNIVEVLLKTDVCAKLPDLLEKHL